ncbi:hypothetical protein ACIBKX_37180 [Streptomyces sp. NPDC050658]|uniref:hypothetical protein n=1 Tax=unclassified Streptomyces TaxID=2593676 RepID=UPI00343F11FE
MRRALLPIAAVSGVLLALVTPSEAFASSGFFYYRHAYTDLLVSLPDPGHSNCITATAKGTVTNATSRDVTFYPDHHCGGEPFGTLPPGYTTDLVPGFHSIIFTPTS